MFQQMLQYLIAASIQLYRDEKNLTIHESGVAACFSHFLKNSVIPNAKGLYYNVQDDPELEFLKKIYRVFKYINDYRLQNCHLCKKSIYCIKILQSSGKIS